MKKNWFSILMLISIVILAIIAVVTSIKLYQIGKEPVAPTVPEPVPAVGPEPTPVPECILEFTITGPTLTPTPSPTVTPTPTPSPTPTGVPPTPTPTPPFSCTGECVEIKAYLVEGGVWTDITADLKAGVYTPSIGETIYFAVRGTTDCASGFTKGRFRINQGAWQETTAKDPSGEYYYITYTIAVGGSYKVEGMLFCPDIGDSGEWK